MSKPTTTIPPFIKKASNYLSIIVYCRIFLFESFTKGFESFTEGFASSETLGRQIMNTKGFAQSETLGHQIKKPSVGHQIKKNSL